MDAWKEICNVTAGLVIPMIADSKADVYDATVPVAKTGSDVPRWDDFLGQNTYVISVEGFAVAARLTINRVKTETTNEH